MADTKISNLTVITSPLSSDVFPIVNNNVTKQVSLYNAFNTASVLASSPNFIYVTAGSSASANGTNLLNSYTTATTLTPNTSALNSTNRTTLVLFPGNYNLGSSSLNLNTQYVDIVGLTRDASHVTITSSNSTATISQTANDVRCIGFTINSTVSAPGWVPSSNLSQAYWENVTFSSISANNLSGYFKNCTSTNTIVGGGGFVRSNGTASGTFDGCTGISINNASYAGGGGFVGNSGTASGKFINCFGKSINNADRASAGGFVGQSGSASGTFINCVGSSPGQIESGGIASGYAGVVSGVFYNCRFPDQQLAGQNCTISSSSIFYNCYMPYGCIMQSTNSGNFYGCSIGSLMGSSSTGTWYISWFGGICDSCVFTNSPVIGYADGKQIMNKGQLRNCTFLDTTLPTLTSSGDATKPACYVNCLDGSGRLVNGSEKYGIY
jgi:hypothetical protein